MNCLHSLCLYHWYDLCQNLISLFFPSSSSLFSYLSSYVYFSYVFPAEKYEMNVNRIFMNISWQKNKGTLYPVYLLSEAKESTAKPAYVVTSIKGSPVLSSHIFWVP